MIYQIILFIYVFAFTAYSNTDYADSSLNEGLAPGWKNELGYKLAQPGSYKLYNIRFVTCNNQYGFVFYFKFGVFNFIYKL